MKGKLYNSKDKSVIMIVIETSKKFAYGFNMRTETYTRELIENLEITDLKTIFNFISATNKTLVVLIATYFHYNAKINWEDIAVYIGLTKRTLYRYVKENEEVVANNMA